MENYERDSEKEELAIDAIQIAIRYCEEKIPIVDSWSSSGLEIQLEKLKEFQDQIEHRRYTVCEDINYKGVY